MEKPELIQNFNTPLSIQAHQHFQDLDDLIQSRESMEGNDLWKYTWGNSMFSTSKASKTLIGVRSTHPIYHWIWKSKCQLKHKVFLWLLLQDRLSTRDLMRRRNMELDS
jgi:hypothetical protein